MHVVQSIVYSNSWFATHDFSVIACIVGTVGRVSIRTQSGIILKRIMHCISEVPVRGFKRRVRYSPAIRNRSLKENTKSRSRRRSARACSAESGAAGRWSSSSAAWLSSLESWGKVIFARLAFSSSLASKKRFLVAVPPGRRQGPGQGAPWEGASDTSRTTCACTTVGESFLA